jgi:hypothetical protein
MATPRNNTDAFPPSRVLPSPAPNSASPSTTLPGTTGQAGAGSTDRNAAQTRSSGRPQPGGANSSALSQDANRTGKNPANENIADCIQLWDRETHMTKQEWARTCRRVQNRLDTLVVPPVDNNTAKRRRQGAL